MYSPSSPRRDLGVEATSEVLARVSELFYQLSLPDDTNWQRLARAIIASDHPYALELKEASHDAAHQALYAYLVHAEGGLWVHENDGHMQFTSRQAAQVVAMVRVPIWHAMSENEAERLSNAFSIPHHPVPPPNALRDVLQTLGYTAAPGYSVAEETVHATALQFIPRSLVWRL